MPVSAVVLLSGGLDSQLAVCLLREQGIEIEALNFATIFTCCRDQAAQAARDLGVRLTVIGQDDDYLELIKKPRFGRGRGANPCVDCRIYMFQRARRFMEEVGARFVASGEVLGQRPMSQKRNDLDVIAYHAGLDGLLLRPLSAQRMAPTIPEKEGWVDRSRLGAITGRSRKELLALAARFGLQHIPAPSTGCALTETQFARKVFDVIEHAPDAGRWEFELLKVGRHFRWDATTKVVVGRREADNVQLEYLHGWPDAAAAALVLPDGFVGPAALLVGPETPASLAFAIGLIVRYSKADDGRRRWVRVVARGASRRVEAVPLPAAQTAQTLGSESPWRT